MTAATPQSGGRWPLVALLVLFLAPAVVAWLLASGAFGWRPASRVNHGELLEPAVPVLGADSGLRPQAPGYWLLLVVVPGHCDRACASAIEAVDRVRQATGRESWRVQVAVASARSPDGLPEAVRIVDPAALTPGAAALAAGQPVLLAVDYRGVAVLRYGWPFDARGALRDLERLLRATRPVPP